jgi:hypothetical protein
MTLAATVACFAGIGEVQARAGGRRLTPDRAFETVWVVDRELPELALWQTLARVTSADAFRPVVIYGGDDGGAWRPSLEHLLEIVPDGRSVWVTERGTLFNVDDTVAPTALELDPGPAVFSADSSLDDVAALIAMRLDGSLTVEPPTGAVPAVLVGVPGPTTFDSPSLYLPDRRAALAYANRLAERSVVMVVRRGGLLPEHVLWASQRDAKIVEVEPGPFDIYAAASEARAAARVRRQIHDALPGLCDGGPPEALVIAGDWLEIPFRVPRGNPRGCGGCDNGVYEYAADLEYANLDGDPWGEPDVPVGRLMSPARDLLAIQTVVGIWREHGAFAAATDGVVLDLLGERGGIRSAVADRWQASFPEQLWHELGPEDEDRNYHLDRDSFLSLVGRSDVVVIHGHGHPDYLSPSGGAARYNQALSGGSLAEHELSGGPSFWFVHACATGKPDRDDWVAEQTLLVGLQRRLAYGSLMAVEIVGAGSADPWWWTAAAEPGLPVGELVRRFAATAIAVYRDGGEPGPGMPKITGDPGVDGWNALGVLAWIGDPLTPVEF